MQHRLVLLSHQIDNMANLLPQEIKKDLRKEYIRRFIIVSFISVSCVLLVSIISLSPTYIVLNAKKDAINEYKNSLIVKEKDDTTPMMSEMKEDVETLKKDTFSINIPYNIFTTFFNIKTEDITVTRISFLQKDNKLQIKGTAANRYSLKDFIDSIGEEEMFFPIENFPYSGFSEPTDLPFDFSIGLANNHGN